MTNLKLDNAALRAQVQEMRVAGEGHKRQILANTLDALVNTYFRQSNLTSMNPLILNNIYAPITLNWTMLMFAYTTHGPLQVAHDQPVLDAFADGIDLVTKELDQDQQKDLMDALETSKLYDTWIDTIIWKRLFGGSALLVNDDTDPEKPFDVERIKKGQRLRFYDASRWELGSPMRLSEYYLFYGQRMHHTRVMTEVGKRAPWVKRFQLAGWGMSEMERMVEPFNIYLRAMNAIYELLNEAKVDVYKLKDFNQQLGSGPKGQQMVQERIQAANRLKGFLNALLLDADDEYVQKQITFTGLAEMANEARIGLAGSLKIPLSKLFGLPAGEGFNSGENEQENYNSMVVSEVRQPARPMIRLTLRALCASMFGRPLDVDFAWKPLRKLSTKEQEEANTARHNRWKDMYDRGVMNAREWADEAHKTGIVTTDLAAAQPGAEDFPMPPMQLGGGGGGGLGGDDEEVDDGSERRQQSRKMPKAD